MSAGKSLLARLVNVEPDQIGIVLQRGLDESYFVGEEVGAFRYILQHFRRYGQVPSSAVVQMESGLDIGDFTPQDPLRFWLDELVQTRVLNDLISGGQELQEKVRRRDIPGAIDCILGTYRSAIRQLDPDSRVSLPSMVEPVVAEHALAQQRLLTGQLPGIPFGMPYIDQMTGGAQAGDSIVLVARPEKGKTYLMLWWALSAFLAGYKVLFITMEMSRVQIARRALSLATGVSARNLRMGTVSVWGLDRLRDEMQRISAGREEDFIILEGRLNRTMDDVGANIRDIRPNIVFKDGAYLVKASKTRRQQAWHEIASDNAEESKAMALDMGIPIVDSHQIRRKGSKLGLEGIGRSDAIGQIASVVMGLGLEEDDEDSSYDMVDRRNLAFLKGREGERGMVRLCFDVPNATIREESVLQGSRYVDEEMEVDVADYS